MDEMTPAPKPLAEMSDREIAEETLTHLRNFTDALNMLSQSPMVGAMMNGGNPMAAMLRGQ